jgi:hypothetical protein
LTKSNNENGDVLLARSLAVVVDVQVVAVVVELVGERAFLYCRLHRCPKLFKP